MLRSSPAGLHCRSRFQGRCSRPTADTWPVMPTSTRNLKQSEAVGRTKQVKPSVDAPAPLIAGNTSVYWTWRQAAIKEEELAYLSPIEA